MDDEPTTLSGVSDALTGAIADLGPELLIIGGVAVGVGVIVLLLRRGWGLIKGFSK